MLLAPVEVIGFLVSLKADLKNVLLFKLVNRTETWKEIILQGIVLGSCIVSSGWQAYNNLKNVEKKIFMDSFVHERKLVELQYDKIHAQNVENKRMHAKVK